MEPFIVSARKYRPTTFEDVVGQRAITGTLEKAIERNHLAQALLFTGPRGVGKTTCARILARVVNAQQSENPEEDFAFNIFELDAASNNGVDDIRSLIDAVRIPPQVGKYKIYIIDEVHMLSKPAFNAFLKTLEEPPAHVIFILATTEKHKILPTILSRCQIFDFKRITVNAMREHLARIAQKEGIQAEEQALQIIAQKADGALRDALSMFDRVVSYSGNELNLEDVTRNLNVLDYDTYFKVTQICLENRIPELLLLVDSILDRGFDARAMIAGLASHLRDLLVCQDERTVQLLEVGDQTKARYLEQSKACTPKFLREAIEIANRCDFEFERHSNQRLHLELSLMQIASITMEDQKKKRNNQLILSGDQVNRSPNPNVELEAPAWSNTAVSSSDSFQSSHANTDDSLNQDNGFDLPMTQVPVTSQTSWDEQTDVAAVTQELHNTQAAKSEDGEVVPHSTVGAATRGDSTHANKLTDVSRFTVDHATREGLDNEVSPFRESEDSITSFGEHEAGKASQTSSVNDVAPETPSPSSDNAPSSKLLEQDEQAAAAAAWEEAQQAQYGTTYSNPQAPVPSSARVSPTHRAEPAPHSVQDTTAPKMGSGAPKASDLAAMMGGTASGMSITGLHEKKALEAKRNAARAGIEQAADAFTLDQFKAVWHAERDKYKTAGDHRRASMMSELEMTQVGQDITLTVPNTGIRSDLETEMLTIITPIRRALNNEVFAVNLKVAERVAPVKQEYIFEPKKKYDYLVGKNPAVDELRKKLDLKFD